MNTTSDKSFPAVLLVKLCVVLGAFAWAALTVLPGLLDKGDPSIGSAAQQAGAAGPSTYSATTRGRSIWLSVPNRSEPVVLQKAHNTSVRALTFSADGSRMASTDGGEITVWDTRSRKRIRTVCTDFGCIDVLASSGERLVAFGESDRRADVWGGDLEEKIATIPVAIPENAEDAFRLALPLGAGRLVAEATGAPAEFESVRDRDGPAALMSEDGQGGIWRLRDNVSGEFVRSYNDGWTGSGGNPPRSLSWHPGGRYAAHAHDESVLIWKLCRRPTPNRIMENGRIFLR